MIGDEDGDGPSSLIKNSEGPLMMSNTGNTFTGGVTVNNGTLHANPGNGTDGVFNSTSGITVNNDGTLQSGANVCLLWREFQA